MRKKDQSKEQIIRDKAIEMIVRDGFDDFGMQKLAKAANVSPATIYIYFKDKEDLILQLYKEIMDENSTKLLKNFDPAMTFSEGLRIQWLNRSTSYMENRNKMIFIEQIRHSSLSEKAAEWANPFFINQMEEFVTKAIRNNELVEVPIEVFWSIAYAPLYNLVRFHESGRSFTGKKFTLDEKMLDLTLSIVLKGLKP